MAAYSALANMLFWVSVLAAEKFVPKLSFMNTL